jgi:hypothetical protein
MQAQSDIQTGQAITEQREAFCPSCSANRKFIFLGEQRWPKRAAEKAGLPEVVYLWRCSVCHTSMLHIELWG